MYVNRSNYLLKDGMKNHDRIGLMVWVVMSKICYYTHFSLDKTSNLQVTDYIFRTTTCRTQPKLIVYASQPILIYLSQYVHSN